MVNRDEVQRQRRAVKYRQYPRISLPESVRCAEKLASYRGGLTVEEYATMLGAASPRSGAFAPKLAGPLHFRLLERRDNLLIATDLLQSIVNPLEDEDPEGARLRAFNNVDLYQELCAILGPGRKNKSLVETIAHRRLGLSSAGAKTFAEKFVVSAEYAGVAQTVDSDHFELTDMATEANPGASEGGVVFGDDDVSSRTSDDMPVAQGNTSEASDKSAGAAEGGRRHNVNIHTDIHIHIPEAANPEQIQAIFEGIGSLASS